MTSSLGAVAETIEILETDTSPVKTMTVLQSAQPGNDISDGVSDMNVDAADSVQSSGDSVVNAYKLRFLNDGKLQTLTEVGEKLIAQFLDRPTSSDGAADLLGINQDIISSTPLRPIKSSKRCLLPWRCLLDPQGSMLQILRLMWASHPTIWAGLLNYRRS